MKGKSGMVRERPGAWQLSHWLLRSQIAEGNRKFGVEKKKSSPGA